VHTRALKLLGGNQRSWTSLTVLDANELAPAELRIAPRRGSLDLRGVAAGVLRPLRELERLGVRCWGAPRPALWDGAPPIRVLHLSTGQLPTIPPSVRELTADRLRSLAGAPDVWRGAALESLDLTIHGTAAAGSFEGLGGLRRLRLGSVYGPLPAGLLAPLVGLEELEGTDIRPEALPGAPLVRVAIGAASVAEARALVERYPRLRSVELRLGWTHVVPTGAVAAYLEQAGFTCQTDGHIVRAERAP
jgi:hypothetical protein